MTSVQETVMNALRLFIIAATGLVVSCAQVTTTPPAAPTAATAVPSPQAAVEHGEVAATPILPQAARNLARAAPVALAATATPVPLTQTGQPAAWWFVFKFNAQSFPACGATTVTRSCSFGGAVQPYTQFSQQYVYASDASPTLQKGTGCVGDTQTDPLGATFDEIYNQPFHFVVWNDQFYDSPKIQGCSQSCSAPWGHSKGTLVWNDAGEGMILQVTTPSWPAAASHENPRVADGNTLGCVKDNDVLVSQHFFALKLNKDDVVKVLTALNNASVVTDTANPELVNNGGPADIQALVATLGVQSTSSTFSNEVLSTGVILISKPSRLHVPPWQFVSAVLGGPSLRTATWWASPKIYTTTASKQMSCWDSSLGKPGRVEIATTGGWDGTDFGLEGGLGADFNHAKIGVSISNAKHLAIFGDMNQQGSISGNCGSSQNGRGGLFFVIDNQALSSSVTALIDGDTAPTKAP
jgi:Deoxyribonuclease II